jgi:hypothetical protein
LLPEEETAIEKIEEIVEKDVPVGGEARPAKKEKARPTQAEKPKPRRKS